MDRGNWTNEQWDAITSGDCNLLLSAAAGSGKTAVLVERMIRLITEGENPVDIDRLLVVTFTSAAAMEMRERIGAAIDKKLAEDSGNAHLQKQMALLSRAKITTIHSFCLEVIRENYHKIGIDPAFRVADQTEVRLLKAEVLEALFEALYSSAEDEGFFGLVESYGENTGDARLRKLALSVYEFIQSSPFPEAWLSEMVSRCQVREEEEFSKSFFGSLAVEEAKTELSGLLALNAAAVRIARAGVLEYLDTLYEDRGILEECYGALSRSYEKGYAVLCAYSFPALKRRKKDTDPFMAEKVKVIREQVKTGLAALRDKFFFKQPEAQRKDLARLYPILLQLADVVLQFQARYQERKLEKQIVDFNDLEHYCLQILLEEGSTDTKPVPSEAARSLQERFLEVLTDEYQDSNQVQELILSVVSRGQNRFMVGDVKQSIYRFRLAKPELFLDKYESFRMDGTGANRRIDLFLNFRSRKTVLDGINFIFRQVMSKKLGELVYDERAALYPGAQFPKAPFGREVGGPVELDLIVASSQDETEEEGFFLEEGEPGDMELEITHIAERIERMVTEGILVAEGKEYRPVCFRDIVVLLRAPAGFSQTVSEVFTGYGIPFYMESNSGYFESTEILVVMSLIRVIDNPRQDIPLLSLLRSPIFHFTSDELVEIRIQAREEDFYQCLCIYQKEHTETALGEKTAAFLARLSGWRERAVYTPVDELLWILYQETGYYDLVGAMKGGKLRQANLRAFLEWAEQYEATSFKGLFHFIQYAEKIRENEADMGTARIMGENENLVRVMSIHKSKGLEFPVVFVSGLGRRFNQMDLTKPLLLHPELGIGSVYIDYENRISYHTLPRAILSRRIQQESLSEELRILYVALTRAKEKLILTGCVKNFKKMLLNLSVYVNEKSVMLPHYTLQKASSYLDWIVPAVARHRDGQVLCDLAEVVCLDQKNGLYYDPASFRVQLVQKGQIVQKTAEERAGIRERAEALSALLYAEEKKDARKPSILLDAPYPYRYAEGLSASISITEIKRAYQGALAADGTGGVFEEEGLMLERPEFLAEAEGLSAAQKGTSMHTVLEHMDFAKEYSRREAAALLAMLCKKGVLKQEEADAVDIKKLVRFSESAFAARIRKARRIEKERAFTLSLSPKEIYGEYQGGTEAVLVHGMVDCYFYEEDGIVLLDFKTDYVTPETLLDVLERYKIQMSIYKKALEQITGEPVKEVYLYLFGMGREVSLDGILL